MGGETTALMIMWSMSMAWNMAWETVYIRSDLRTLVPLVRDLMVNGNDRRLILLFL